MGLDVAWVDRRQVGIEIARLGIRICLGIAHHVATPKQLTRARRGVPSRLALRPMLPLRHSLFGR